MPTFRSVVSVLLRALGDVSLTLKAGPGGGRLRRPSPRRQRHDGTGEPASSSKPRDHEARRIWPHQPSGTAGAVVVVAIRRRKVHRMRRWTLVAGLTAALLIYSGEALADAQPARQPAQRRHQHQRQRPACRRRGRTWIEATATTLSTEAVPATGS
jgi:hypothetical protein